MTKVAAFHTNSPEYPPTHRNVYHYESECGYGKEIKQEHRVAGDGNRPPCSQCQFLSA